MKNFISFVCIFVISIFFSVNNCLSDEINSELNNDISNELKYDDAKNDINDKADLPEASNKDIFGDEQTFPFIAGLGKNAAH